MPNDAEILTILSPGCSGRQCEWEIQGRDVADVEVRLCKDRLLHIASAPLSKVAEACPAAHAAVTHVTVINTAGMTCCAAAICCSTRAAQHWNCYWAKTRTWQPPASHASSSLHNYLDAWVCVAQLWVVCDHICTSVCSTSKLQAKRLWQVHLRIAGQPASQWPP